MRRRANRNFRIELRHLLTSHLPAIKNGTVMATSHLDKKESDPALRVRALESILAEKGLIDPKALDALVDTYENKIGPRNGSKVVARALVIPNTRNAF